MLPSRDLLGAWDKVRIERPWPHRMEVIARFKIPAGQKKSSFDVPKSCAATVAAAARYPQVGDHLCKAGPLRQGPHAAFIDFMSLAQCSSGRQHS